MHDLHRQLGTAPGSGGPAGPGPRPLCCGRAEREPELRGSDSQRGARELPRLADARGRLRPRGPNRPRPYPRASRATEPMARRSSCATSGRRPRRSEGSSRRASTRPCSRTSTGASRWGITTGNPSTRPRAPSTDGPPTPRHPRPGPLSRPPGPWLPANAVLVEGSRALALLGDRVSTDHISPAGEYRRIPPRGSTCSRTGSRSPISTRTARAEATTR